MLAGWQSWQSWQSWQQQARVKREKKEKKEKKKDKELAASGMRQADGEGKGCERIGACAPLRCHGQLLGGW
jgi:hypothetical protein